MAILGYISDIGGDFLGDLLQMIATVHKFAPIMRRKGKAEEPPEQPPPAVCLTMIRQGDYRSYIFPHGYNFQGMPQLEQLNI